MKLKALLDFILAGLAIIILAPALLVLYLLIRWRLGSPVLFKQSRTGIDGTLFILYKYRSMLDSRDENGELLPDENRLTKFGLFLRSTSLDELPSLFNILKGDMSLIGPRPLLPQYLPLYTKAQFRRHEVKPGLSGWAQVNGRNAIAWEEKFNYDVWYVDNQSLRLDVKIIFMTLSRVFAREGISKAGEATTSRFTGSDVED